MAWGDYPEESDRQEGEAGRNPERGGIAPKMEGNPGPAKRSLETAGVSGAVTAYPTPRITAYR